MKSNALALQNHLTDQLIQLDTSLEQLALLRLLIDRIDANGYLPVGLEELARSQTPPIALARLREALHALQTLEPRGVGARDLRECLLLQVSDETPNAEVVRRLIGDHLDDVQHHRKTLIEQRTGLTRVEIDRAVEVLRHLHPKPGTQVTRP